MAFQGNSRRQSASGGESEGDTHPYLNEGEDPQQYPQQPSFPDTTSGGGEISDTSSPPISGTNVSNSAPNVRGGRDRPALVSNRRHDDDSCSDVGGDVSNQHMHIHVMNMSTDNDSSSDSVTLRRGSARQADNVGSRSDDSVSLTRDENREEPLFPDDFVDILTQKTADSRCFHNPRIRHSFCRPAGSRKDATSLLESLRKIQDTANRAELGKEWHYHLLPNLVKRKGWSDIAAFLEVKDTRPSAMAALETFLLQLCNSQDTEVTSQVLHVATVTKNVIIQLSDDNDDLMPLTCLYLLAVSAALSRCPLPSAQQCAQLVVSKKQGKKKSGQSLKHVVLRCLQTFCEGLEEVLDKTASYHEWDQCLEDSARRKSEIERSSFCELVFSLYTLFNELTFYGWHERSERLLAALQDVVDSSTLKSGKNKLSDDLKAVLDFFLVRQMVVLLNSTFDEDEPRVGTHHNTYNKELARLIVDVAMGANQPTKRCIQREMECLPFHRSTLVRKQFNDFFHYSGTRLTQLAQGYMANSLEVIDFRRCNSSSGSSHAGSQEKAHESCSWKTFSCSIGRKEAECAMYCPRPECLTGKMMDLTCLNQHPGRGTHSAEVRQKMREDSRRHVLNLNMLKKLSTRCRHLVQLYSYQVLPFPFYITERVSQRRLLTHLLAHRHAQLWLQTPTLVHVMTHILDALLFLRSRNIDPRGVTAYNVIVQPGEETGQTKRLSGTWCSVLTRDNFVVKLGDLGLAHEYQDSDPTYNEGNIRPVHSQGAVPLRWTSPEALFDGLYSEKNMVYNAGCLLYELWTHGCQPFSSFDQTLSTEEILTQMLTLPSSIKMIYRPCVPPAVYDLITRCSHHRPGNRPCLQTVKNELLELCSREQLETSEPEVERLLARVNEYPPLSQSQVDRDHIPETGIPMSVQELIDADKNSYINARKPMWVPSKYTVVTDEELQANDWVRVLHQEQRTIVEEVVSPEFVRDYLPSLRASDQFYGVTSSSQIDDLIDGSPKVRIRDGITLLKREYPRSVSLETAARKGLLWQRKRHLFEEDGVGRCGDWIIPLTSLAGTMSDLHKKGWILRSLKESDVLIDTNKGEVVLSRIGRMHRLPSKESHCVGEVYEDCRRWLGPEVLLNGQYGKENDVFMLGTVIQQVFRINEIITKTNPNATTKDFAPCSNIEKKQVVSYARDPNRIEPAPSGCPDWLHKLSVRCRQADPSSRPSAQEVFDTLHSHRPISSGSSPFLSYPSPDNLIVPVRAANNQDIVTSTVRPQRKNRTRPAPPTADPRSQPAKPGPSNPKAAKITLTSQELYSNLAQRSTCPLPPIPSSDPDHHQTCLKTFTNEVSPETIYDEDRGQEVDRSDRPLPGSVIRTADLAHGIYAHHATRHSRPFSSETFDQSPNKMQKKEKGNKHLAKRTAQGPSVDATRIVTSNEGQSSCAGAANVAPPSLPSSEPNAHPGLRNDDNDDNYNDGNVYENVQKMQNIKSAVVQNAGQDGRQTASIGQSHLDNNDTLYYINCPRLRDATGKEVYQVPAETKGSHLRSLNLSRSPLSGLSTSAISAQDQALSLPFPQPQGRPWETRAVPHIENRILSPDRPSSHTESLRNEQIVSMVEGTENCGSDSVGLQTHDSDYISDGLQGQQTQAVYHNTNVGCQTSSTKPAIQDVNGYGLERIDSIDQTGPDNLDVAEDVSVYSEISDSLMPDEDLDMETETRNMYDEPSDMILTPDIDPGSAPNTSPGRFPITNSENSPYTDPGSSHKTDPENSANTIPRISPPPLPAAFTGVNPHRNRIRQSMHPTVPPGYSIHNGKNPCRTDMCVTGGGSGDGGGGGGGGQKARCGTVPHLAANLTDTGVSRGGGDQFTQYLLPAEDCVYQSPTDPLSGDISASSVGLVSFGHGQGMNSDSVRVCPLLNITNTEQDDHEGDSASSYLCLSADYLSLRADSNSDYYNQRIVNNATADHDDDDNVDTDQCAIQTDDDTAHCFPGAELTDSSKLPAPLVFCNACGSHGYSLDDGSSSQCSFHDTGSSASLSDGRSIILCFDEDIRSTYSEAEC